MQIEIYKKGQGKYTRLCSGFAAAIVIGIGCQRLYVSLSGISWGFDEDTIMMISTLIPAALFVILGIMAFWAINKPSVADFMISAEGEMKKVNWPSRKEVAISTYIVIIVVLLMAILLGSSDFLFQMFFGKLFLG